MTRDSRDAAISEQRVGRRWELGVLHRDPSEVIPAPNRYIRTEIGIPFKLRSNETNPIKINLSYDR